MAKEQIYISLDIETTGLDPKTDEIIEIGAIKFSIQEGPTLGKKRKKILDRFSNLVNPQRKVPSSVLVMTGINEEELKKAPSFSEIKGKLKKFIGDYPLVGHNIDFDCSFLDRKKFSLKNLRYDTWYLSTMLLGALDSHSLASLVSLLEIEQVENHRALSDAEATAHLFLILTEKLSQIPSEVASEIKQVLAKSNSPLGNLFKTIRSFPQKKKISLPKQKIKQLSLPGIKKLTPYIKNLTLRPDEIETLKIIHSCLGENKKAFIESQASLYAYLIPAIVHSTSKRIVLAVLRPESYLEAMAELEKMLPFDFRPTILKEAEEYLCLEKFNQFKKEAQNEDELRFLVKILLWLAQTKRGEKNELALLREERKFWKLISADQFSCSSHLNCFFRKAQEEAFRSNLIIIPQAFLFKDFRRSEALIPPTDYLFLDQTHNMEDVATYSLGWHLSFSDFSDFLFEIEILGARLKDKEISSSIEKIKKSSDIFFLILGMLIKNYGQKNREGRRHLIFDQDTKYLKDYPKIEGAVKSLYGRFLRLSSHLEEIKREKGEAQIINLEGMFFKIKEIKNNLKTIVERPKKEGIYWGELKKRGAEITLQGVPKDISKLIPLVFKNKKGVILTSGTLTLKNSFHYFKKRLGLFRFEEFKIKKSFPTPASLIIIEDFPEEKASIYKEKLTYLLLKIVSEKKKILVLFGSEAKASEIFQDLQDGLQKKKIDTFLYHRLTSKKTLENFQALKKAIMFISQASFARLEEKKLERSLDFDCLVLCKLPFETPFHPISFLRQEALKNGFSEYLLSRAIIKFNQIIEKFRNLSRLPEKPISLIVADSRISSQSYGLDFIESLKNAKVSYKKFKDFRQAVDNF